MLLAAGACLGREVNWLLRLASIKGLGELMTSRLVDSTDRMLRKAFSDQRFVTRELLTELRRTNRLPGARAAALKVIRNCITLQGIKSEFVLAKDLGEVEMPVLVVWGAEDRILPVKHAHRAGSSNPRADIHVFGGCGHWPHMERSEEFNALALEFLSR